MEFINFFIFFIIVMVSMVVGYLLSETQQIIIEKIQRKKENDSIVDVTHTIIEEPEIDVIHRPTIEQLEEADKPKKQKEEEEEMDKFLDELLNE
jgi:hypothetical protein